MRQKLETAANISVIVVGLMLAFLFVRTYVPFGGSPAPTLNPIEPGTHLVVKGIRWEGSQRTLLLVLQVGCRFCNESVPFYGHLEQLQKNGQIQAQIVVVFPNDPQSAKAMLKSAGLPFAAVPGVDLGTLGVSGTPTAIVLDEQGRVLKSWLGVLSSAAQKDLITSLGAVRVNVPQVGPTPQPNLHFRAHIRV